MIQLGRMRRVWGGGLLWLLPLLLVGCEDRPATKQVRLATAGKGEAARASDVRKVPLRVAVAPVISPRENFKLYGALLDYLSREIGRPVDFIQRRTYSEINDLVRYGHADVAFVCDYAYVVGQRDFGMRLLVVPQVGGTTFYRSYIIVPQGSQAQRLEDLRGKSFAFSDPLSSSGWLYPAYRLRLAGEAPDGFFKRYVFTYSHDNTVKAVSDKLVDGGAVDSLVYEYMVARDSHYGQRTRVIEQSDLWGNPPVVVHPRLDPQLREQIQRVLLTMHERQEGQRILAELMIDRFIVLDERPYDPIRRMVARLGGVP